MADAASLTPSERGPHAEIAVNSARDRHTARLFDRLWDRYRERVTYVRTYERIVAEHGARFVNDHIAFRTFATQSPLSGIAAVSRPLEALGYVAAGVYRFPDKWLAAVHFQHPVADLPKIFISELQTWRLPAEARAIIARATATQRPGITMDDLAAMDALSAFPADAPIDESLLDCLAAHFHQLPWSPPDANDVQRINQSSQYAAWVLVHGYNVNHFTSLINSHGVPPLCDIERTIDALRAASVPMKSEIEGERGSKLRQSATEAVQIVVPMTESGREVLRPWTYAYFELAERGDVFDPETGERRRFEGFLGPQATNLFEMTRVRQ